MLGAVTFQIFDTATRQLKDFEPLREGHASIYLCGATPQAQPHIGHVRSGVAFDILRRWLIAKGYDVAFVRNVTDIDDKILNKAAEHGRLSESARAQAALLSQRMEAMRAELAQARG